jgi:hypothetical protein
LYEGGKQIDKKPLIGVSISAVILLVLGSLSNVVGYQSVKSTAISDSPLFSMRTQRANNQQQNILTSQYLGMRNRNLLQFPIRDNRTESLKKAIEYISKMDDKTFAQFIEVFLQRIRQEKTFSNPNLNEIIQMLRQLRIKPEIFTNGIIELLTFLSLLLIVIGTFIMYTFLLMFGGKDTVVWC